MTRKLSENQESLVLRKVLRIYDLLHDNPQVMFTITDIMRALGDETTKGIKPRLLFLIRLRLVERVKGGETGRGYSSTQVYYTIMKNDR